MDEKRIRKNNYGHYVTRESIPGKASQRRYQAKQPHKARLRRERGVPNNTAYAKMKKNPNRVAIARRCRKQWGRPGTSSSFPLPKVAPKPKTRVRSVCSTDRAATKSSQSIRRATSSAPAMRKPSTYSELLDYLSKDNSGTVRSQSRTPKKSRSTSSLSTSRLRTVPSQSRPNACGERKQLQRPSKSTPNVLHTRCTKHHWTEEIHGRSSNQRRHSFQFPKEGTQAPSRCPKAGSQINCSQFARAGKRVNSGASARGRRTDASLGGSVRSCSRATTTSSQTNHSFNEKTKKKSTYKENIQTLEKILHDALSKNNKLLQKVTSQMKYSGHKKEKNRLGKAALQSRSTSRSASEHERPTQLHNCSVKHRRTNVCSSTSSVSQVSRKKKQNSASSTSCAKFQGIKTRPSRTKHLRTDQPRPERASSKNKETIPSSGLKSREWLLTVKRSTVAPRRFISFYN